MSSLLGKSSLYLKQCNNEKSKLLNRLVTKTKAGDIVLLHDNLPQTVSILQEYIDKSTVNGILFASGELKNKLKYD